jgi:hypothetical protein
MLEEFTIKHQDWADVLSRPCKVGEDVKLRTNTGKLVTFVCDQASFSDCNLGHPCTYRDGKVYREDGSLAQTEGRMTFSYRPSPITWWERNAAFLPGIAAIIFIFFIVWSVRLRHR